MKLTDYFQALTESFQDLLAYGFILLFWVAVALFAYMGVRALLEKLRTGGSEEGDFHPGPFRLWRGGILKDRFARRHKVQVRGHWDSSGKWIPRE